MFDHLLVHSARVSHLSRSSHFEFDVPEVTIPKTVMHNHLSIHGNGGRIAHNMNHRDLLSRFSIGCFLCPSIRMEVIYAYIFRVLASHCTISREFSRAICSYKRSNSADTGISVGLVELATRGHRQESISHGISGNQLVRIAVPSQSCLRNHIKQNELIVYQSKLISRV